MLKIKGILLIAVTIIMILVLITASINIYMIQYSKRYIVDKDEVSNDIDAILVLGAYVYPSGDVSPMLQDRLDTAVEIYAKTNVNILVSGDHGRKAYDEVRGMKNYLLDRDISEEDIFMDHAGFCTYDSMYRAKAIFDIEKTIVCTQTYHLYRAIYIARKLGIDAYGVSSDLRIYPGMRYYNFREIFARVKDFFSIIVKVKPKYLGPKIDIHGSGLKTEDY